MQRQLLSAGLEPVVATADPLIAAASDRSFEPPRRRWTAETLLSCIGLWGQGRTIVLLGDVVYSAACMASIVTCELPLVFFTKRKGKSKEIVALSFSAAAAESVERASRAAVMAAEAGLPEARLAHIMAALRPSELSCIRVIDWTQDFDTQDDWDSFDQSVVDDRPCHEDSAT